MSEGRSSITYRNALAYGWTCNTLHNVDVEIFHRKMPEYNQTPLVSLPMIAKELGIGSLLVKDESHRFGLPAFKILGASWAVYKAVLAAVGLDSGISLTELGVAAASKGIRLVTCTDGNWGRSVARMAKHMTIPSRVYVPRIMDEPTRKNILTEGAEVRVVPGDYDASIAAARKDADETNDLLVMDTSWPGYETIPRWVVEGYSTMLLEADRQIHEQTGRSASCVIAPVGVGSFAQAVTEHYKGQKPSATVVTVEPTTAACLKASLEAGEIVPIETGETIMCGMNCGTVSSLAWPVLSKGVDACVAVTDAECHEALQSLQDEGINCGPCGAAPLAALSKVCGGKELGLNKDSVVILFCTEGSRPYTVASA